MGQIPRACRNIPTAVAETTFPQPTDNIVREDTWNVQGPKHNDSIRFFGEYRSVGCGVNFFSKNSGLGIRTFSVIGF